MPIARNRHALLPIAAVVLSIASAAPLPAAEPPPPKTAPPPAPSPAMLAVRQALDRVLAEQTRLVAELDTLPTDVGKLELLMRLKRELQPRLEQQAKELGELMHKLTAAEQAEVAVILQTAGKSAGAEAVAAKLQVAASNVLAAMVKGELVAHAVAAGATAYVSTWSQEGTGIGASLMVRKDGANVETALYTPDDADTDKTLAKNLPTALVVLLDHEYVFLPAQSWDGKAAVALPGQQGALSWKGGKLLWRSGKTAPKLLAQVKPSKPFKAAPDAVFARAGVPVAVVRVQMDPGSHYGEGFNIHAEFEVLALPGAATAEQAK